MGGHTHDKNIQKSHDLPPRLNNAWRRGRWRSSCKSCGGGLELKAAEGDELAVLQGTGSGYATRKTTTDSHGVGWVLRTGQNGYLGVNNATNHNNVSITDTDLPVVQGAVANATVGQGGIYYYYTTTPVANVGSLVFSYSAANNCTNANAKLYVVSGNELSDVGGAPYELVTLSDTSDRAQGYQVDSNSGATHTFKFTQTQADAKYYGLVVVVDAYQRYTAGKIQLLEGASLATLTGLEAIIGEENLYTTDVLNWEDFLVDGTKSDGTDVTVEDVTASIGDGTDFRPVEWGVTQPLVTDTTVRFTSLLANTSGEYESVDVTIHVSEPAVTQIAISGDMTTKNYAVGLAWDPTGLTVTGTLSPEGTINLTNEVVWSYDPATAELGTTEVKVTATYNDLVAETTVTGITVVNEISDIIDKSDVPQPTGNASYANWTPEGTAATYVVHSYTKQNYIQLRAESPSGIVSTISGGKIKSITIEWTASTAAGRNLSIYASNSPYSSPADLYSESVNAITALNKGNNETTYEFTEEYSYVGVRSASGSLYLDSITFVWQADVITSVESVEVVGTMNKTEYYTNEEWKADGLSVNLHYSDGEVSNITTGYTLTWSPATPVLGTKQVSVTATYNNVTSAPVTFNVTVEEYVEPVYSYHPTTNPEEFTESDGSYVSAGSFTAEGLGWEFYMTGTEAATSDFDDTKGLHFGTGSKPADTVTLYSDIFAATTGETMINRIVVNASSAAGNDGAATMTIKVNNEVVNTVTLTSTATDYSTVLDTPVWGSVEIVLTNGGKKAAMYFGGIDIFAETDATVTASLVAAVNGLLDFRTCEISATHQEFGAWLDANRTTIEDNREVLANLVAHDYESMDITYTGDKTSIVNVLAKYDACVARYETANGALAPTIFGNEDTTIAVVVVIITLAAITALVGFYYFDKRRRVNK